MQKISSSSKILPLIVATALFMDNMDGTIIATSLPAIAHDLGTDPIVLKLAFTSYLLSLTIFIPVSGWLADRLGAKNVFRSAIVVFLIGSILCGQAQSLGTLVAARFFQGVGGAMMVPVGRIIILRGVPKSELVNAMAWLTIPALMGPLIGPVVGGFITTYFSWRWIFWMNVPMGIIGIIAASLYMPNVKEAQVAPLDVSGFVLSSLGLSFLVSGLSVFGRDLLPLSFTLGLMAAGVGLVVAYVFHALRTPHPLLDLRLLKKQTFRVGVYGGSLFRIGVGAVPFLLPLLLQLGFGYSPFNAGLLTSFAALGSIMMKFTAKRMMRWLGFRKLLVINGILACLVMAQPAFFDALTPVWLMAAFFTLGGFFRSLQFTSLNALAYSDIDKREASSAATLFSVAQQLSLSAGVAVAAFALEIAQRWRGDATLTEGDFTFAFVVVAAIAMLSVFEFIGLKPDAGASVLAKSEPDDEVA